MFDLNPDLSTVESEKQHMYTPLKTRERTLVFSYVKFAQ